MFGLKPGEVAGPIRSPFGFHVVKALEVVPGSKKELREVAPTLRASLVAERQQQALRDRAEAEQQALVTASDFAAEAGRRGLSVREIGPLAKADAVEGVGRVREATDGIFGLASGAVSSAIRVPEGYAIFHLVEIQPSRVSALTEVREDVVRAVRREKADAAARAKATALVEAVRRGDEVAKANDEQQIVFGWAYITHDKDGKQQVDKSGELISDPAELEKARGELEGRLLRDKRARLWQEWVTSLRGAAKIEVNRKILPES